MARELGVINYFRVIPLTYVMPLKIIRYLDCELDKNWHFSKEGASTTVIVGMISWTQGNNRIIYAAEHGASINVGFAKDVGTTLQFKKGAMVSLQNALLVYDTADALKGN